MLKFYGNFKLFFRFRIFYGIFKGDDGSTNKNNIMTNDRGKRKTEKKQIVVMSLQRNKNCLNYVAC